MLCGGMVGEEASMQRDKTEKRPSREGFSPKANSKNAKHFSLILELMESALPIYSKSFNILQAILEGYFGNFVF